MKSPEMQEDEKRILESIRAFREKHGTPLLIRLFHGDTPGERVHCTMSTSAEVAILDTYKDPTIAFALAPELVFELLPVMGHAAIESMIMRQQMLAETEAALRTAADKLAEAEAKIAERGACHETQEECDAASAREAALLGAQS